MSNLQLAPGTTALVVDGNVTTRNLLSAQLRDYGISRVVQCSKVQEARARMETGSFDYVLCDQYFNDKSATGQTLLDDLRRAQLLPFTTVFFMVTTEASYAAVAEAAESALDGYLLKPFTTQSLHERLRTARLRKLYLKPIFEAIERQDLEAACALCVEQFKERRPYWLYAARIGSELLLRLGQHEDAKMLFQAILEAKAIPWARLGIARTQMESGTAGKSILTLNEILSEDPSYADAYDVLGRAYVEAGQFGKAIETYRAACGITPDSVLRLQKLGMLSYYTGEDDTALQSLLRAVVLSLHSKLFDYQTLVLLGFLHFKARDDKGLDRCVSDFTDIAEKYPESRRIQRFPVTVQTLQHIRKGQVGRAVDAVRRLAREIHEPGFDMEAACNFCGLLSALSSTSIVLSEGDEWIEAIGMRFAVTRGVSELLASACRGSAPYAELMRRSLQSINQLAEHAMARSLGGEPLQAITGLLAAGRKTLNAKLIDLAQQLLARRREQLEDAEQLQTEIHVLRMLCGNARASGRITLGREDNRQPGGMVLPTAIVVGEGRQVAA